MPRLRPLLVALLFSGLTAFVLAQPPTPDPKGKGVDPKAKAPEPAPKPPEPTPPAPKPPEPTPPAPKPPEPTPPAAKTPDAPKAPDGAVAFTLKLEKGKPFFQEMSTTVSQKLKVQGQDLSQTQEQSFTFEWTPEKQEGDKWTLKMKVIRVKMKIDISNNPIEYDSLNKSTTGSAGTPGLTDFFKNLEGSEFTVILNTKDNKVEKVDGRDAFIKRLSAGNTQLEGLLRKIITQEAEMQMTDPTFGLLPAEPKAPGATWESKGSLNLGPIGSYEVVNKYTLKPKEKDKEDVLVEIVPTLTYKLPGDSSEGLLFKIKSGDIKSEPSTTPGSLRFDPKAGRIIEAKIPLKLAGNLEVTIGGTDTKIELRQEQTTTIKMTDTNPLNPPAAPPAVPPTPPAPPK